MAKNKFDGVIVAAHFDKNRQVEWVRAYLKKGPVFTDRVHLAREDLIAQIKAGKKFITGRRIEFEAATFETNHPVRVGQSNGSEFLVTGENQVVYDNLEGVPEV